MSDNPEDLIIKQDKAAAALLGFQTAARRRNPRGSTPLDRRLAPARRVF